MKVMSYRNTVLRANAVLPNLVKTATSVTQSGKSQPVTGIIFILFWGGGGGTQSSPPGRNVSLTLRKSARCFKTPMRTSSKSLRNPSNTGSRSR